MAYIYVPNEWKTNDLITADKLNNLEGSAAEVDKLKTVATTGSYNDLKNKPTIEGQELDGNLSLSTLGFADVATSGSYTDLLNAPTIGGKVLKFGMTLSDLGISTAGTSGRYADLTEKPQINGHTLEGNKTAADLELVYTLPTASAETLGGIKVGTGLAVSEGVLNVTGKGVTADKVDWSGVQNKPNIPTSTSDLTNDSTFQTKAQVDAAIAEKMNNISIKKQTVETLPDVSDMQEDVLYLVKSLEPGSSNIYDEYMLIENKAEKIGSTETDLSNYVKKDGNKVLSSNDFTDAYKTKLDNFDPESNGTFFTPSVDEEGNLSWKNNGGLDNPETVNIKGPIGLTGPEGPVGPAGATGNTGPEGPQGATGATGDYWYPTVTSEGLLSFAKKSSSVSSDPPEAINIKGETGPMGPMGPAGPSGEGLKGDKGETGEKGDTGAPGSLWYSGTVLTGTDSTANQYSSADLTTTYRIGDYYLNSEQGYVYRCTTAGSGENAKWTYQGCIQGPQGKQGDQGSIGPAGPTGSQGPVGPAGTSIGTITVTADDTTGSPSCTVSPTSVSDGKQNFTFRFSGIKGSTGPKGTGIRSAELTSDYKLKLNYDDGTSFTSTNSLRGPTGEKGEQGNDGAAGLGMGDITVGFIGHSTATNPTCTVVPKENGSKKDYTLIFDGLKGATGDAGPAGPAGPAGAAGNKWYSGTLLSSTGSGEYTSSSLTSYYYIGDYYLNTTYGYVYRCTAAGTGTGAKWTYQGSIRGPQGATGSNGSNGAAGAAGRGVGTITVTTDGTYSASPSCSVSYSDSGTTTRNYTLSFKGLRGATGSQGPTGPTGPQGATGAAGTSAVYTGATSTTQYSASSLTNWFSTNLQNKFLLGDVTIDCSSSSFTSGTLTIKNIGGFGKISISGGKFSAITITNCTCLIEFTSAVVTASTSSGIAVKADSSRVYLNYCTLQGQWKILSDNGSDVRACSCSLNAGTYGAGAQHGGIVWLYQCTGTSASSFETSPSTGGGFINVISK